MPVIIKKDLPSYSALEKKGVFVMDADRAKTQDIRPLRIGILNLMPDKKTTETQLLRMIGSTPLQIEPILIRTATYTPKNTSARHLEAFYDTFENVKKSGLDCLLITGAPIETLSFEEVFYWSELVEIMKWASAHVASTLHLCWAAQAGLYYHYGIPKYPLKRKLFGVYKHFHGKRGEFLLTGLDDEFWVAHSRHTEVRRVDLAKIKDLQILIDSKEAGPHLIANKSKSLIFMIGHPEYDRDTLAAEYFRDLKKGKAIAIPKNYFPGGNPDKTPILSWRANAEMFYRNWINFVYQTTPYDLITREFNLKS